LNDINNIPYFEYIGNPYCIIRMGGKSPAGAGFNWVTEGNDFKGKAGVEKLVITPTF
jgi:hypothetical protein